MSTKAVVVDMSSKYFPRVLSNHMSRNRPINMNGVLLCRTQSMKIKGCVTAPCEVSSDDIASSALTRRH